MLVVHSPIVNFDLYVKSFEPHPLPSLITNFPWNKIVWRYIVGVAQHRKTFVVESVALARQVKLGNAANSHGHTVICILSNLDPRFHMP